MPKHNTSPCLPTLPEKLIQWYQEKSYSFPWRENRDPYAVWISEIMLQQTTVKTVPPYFLNFLKTFPTIEALANSNLDNVLGLWQGLGYYRRAENIYKAAQQIMQAFKGKFPQRIDDIKTLSGIGDYTSASIAAIAFEQPFVPIDGNVKRVLSRIFGISNCPKTIKLHTNCLEAEIKDKNASPRFFAESLMDLGREVCKPKNPLCEDCPISSLCKAFLEKKQQEYLPLSKPIPQPTKYANAYIIQKENCILLEKRSDQSLLKGLWQVPLTEFQKLPPLPSPPKTDIFLGRIKHVFSHFKLIVDVYQKNYQHYHPNPNQEFVSLNEITSYPLPKLVQKIIKLSGFYQKDAA